MIIIGVILLLYPEISIVILPFVVGFWLMFAGAYLIAGSLELQETTKEEIGRMFEDYEGKIDKQ